MQFWHEYVFMKLITAIKIMNISVTSKVSLGFCQSLPPGPSPSSNWLSFVLQVICMALFFKLFAAVLLHVLIVYCFLFLSSISLYGYTTNYLSTHLLIIWLIPVWCYYKWNWLTFMCKCFCRHMILFPFSN